MNPVRVAIAAIILLLGIWVNTSPDLLEDWIDNQTTEPPEEPNLVGLQENEEWLILRVEFPNRPFDQNDADEMFSSDGPASQYIDQMSGSKSALQPSLSESIWVSPNPESHWGYDTDQERDVSASSLVEAVCKDLLEGKDLSKWDFNGDGIVDRLLILHSGRAQESGAGSDALWSHMSWLIEPLELGEWSVSHYTIASLDSGIGTVIHEMIHQMGAYDLYDVHSDIPTSNWNGLGDWDIMASGNWNDNGNTPALPGAATLDQIGANRYGFDIYNSWNGSRTLSLDPISQGGHGLRIGIAPGETIWISYRENSGFDSGLPGHGILVEHSDENNGNPVENLVNTDPDNAWVKIVEADGDAALERGRDSGSAGDVFTSGDSFGASGMKIRDNRGRLVDWTVSVDDISNSTATVSITFYEFQQFSILTPRTPIQLLPTEPLLADVWVPSECSLEISLDNHEVSNLVIPEGDSVVEIMPLDEYPSDSFTISGTISTCVGAEEEHLGTVDILLEVDIVGHRMSNQELYSVISWENPSTIELTPKYQGEGEMTYSISIEGAASRITSAQTPSTLSPGDPIILDIEPMDLLEPGMIARGTIVLSDSHGHEHRIPLLLEAESPFSGDGWLAWFAEPSNGLFVISILLSISIITGGRKE